MATGKDRKLERYRLIYEEELRLQSNLGNNLGDTVDEDSETEDKPKFKLPKTWLRSGKAKPIKPPRRVPTNITKTPTNSAANMPDPNASDTNPFTLKVLPAEASVRRYTGDEDGYTARTYISACEDVMRHAGTTAPKDKIAFVRSRVAPNSRAERLLESVLLSSTIIGDDYDTFKENFLLVFGGGAESSLLKQINHVTEDVASRLGALDLWDSSVPSGNVTEACIRLLEKEDWLQDNKTSLSTVNLRKFLQIFFMMLYARGNVRKAASSLTFKPTDKISQLFTQIEAKVTEKGGARGPAVASILPPTDPTPSYAAAVVKKPAMTCDYCHKVGHNSKRCLKRRKDEGKNTSARDDWTPKPASGETAPSVRPKTTYKSSHMPEASGKANQQRNYYCALHGQQGSHGTDRCYSLRRMREDEERKRFSGVKSSGEAARPGTQNPG